MNKELEIIINSINNSLEKALPADINGKWVMDSFGNLPQAVSKEHISPLIQPNKELISLGGKRWRPVLMILLYKALLQSGCSDSLTEEEVYSITPLVEFVHTASLIHDDIEDSADLRRGKPAAHITYGIDTALNSASWLYFEAPVCINNLNISPEKKLILLQAYSQELRKLHLGQAMDIYWHRIPSLFPKKEEYLAMVKNKTGTLASLAAKIGSLAANFDVKKAEEMAEISANMGIGFQIIDDVTNLTTGNVGKKRGDDIVEGKKSLPVLIHTEKFPEDKKLIAKYMEQAFKEGIDSPAVENCLSLLEKSNCIKEAAEIGTNLIRENCSKFNSDLITELFNSMIPEQFR